MLVVVLITESRRVGDMHSTQSDSRGRIGQKGQESCRGVPLRQCGSCDGNLHRACYSPARPSPYGTHTPGTVPCNSCTLSMEKIGHIPRPQGQIWPQGQRNPWDNRFQGPRGPRRPTRTSFVSYLGGQLSGTPSGYELSCVSESGGCLSP